MIPLSAWPRALGTVARTFGARGLLFRAKYEIRRLRGGFRRGPQAQPIAVPKSASPFMLDAAQLAAAVDPEVAIMRGNRIDAGEYEAFRWNWRAIPSTPTDWRRNFATGRDYPLDAPWWRIAHLNSAVGDIKDVWEPARFGWVFDLVRAFAVTQDVRYVEAFARHFAAWCDASPPFSGVHWSCGQETAIRAIALLYAEANLNLRDGDRQRVVNVLGASGERIADAIEYAISQRNNHGISEAAGLVALGVRLQGVHPEADQWLEMGSRWLRRLIEEQFAPDGWYVQHSFTYLRVALDQCVVAERALRAVGQRLPPACAERLRAATDLLVAVTDTTSGVVPNYGANDGAFVHPITSAEYRDFRPVITAAASLFGAAMPSNLSPNREVLAWLGVSPPPTREPVGDGVISGSSGWATARVGRMFAFFRAGQYTSRPSHLDPLQLDVRIDGREVVVDPGTFAYQGPGPWRNGLVTARVHNGPLVDDMEPGIRGPRFLWFAWPGAQLLHASHTPGRAVVVAEVPGRVTRRVEMGTDSLTVEDRVAAASGARRLVVRWLRHPAALDAVILSDPPAQTRPAREGDSRGWFSPHYGQRLPSVLLEVEAPAANETRVVTTIHAPPSVLGREDDPRIQLVAADETN